MQQTRYPTVSIQSRLKRVKLVRMTPERVPAPENESTVALPFPVPQKPAWHTFLGTPLCDGDGMSEFPGSRILPDAEPPDGKAPAVGTANRPIDNSDQAVSWLWKGQSNVIAG